MSDEEIRHEMPVGDVLQQGRGALFAIVLRIEGGLR
jgi:hypothetical protein